MTDRAKRNVTAGSGTPAWMVTYADMMGLLLCFFVMLVAMSELRTERFQRAMQSIREAFGGNPESSEQVGMEDDSRNSLMNRLAVIQNRQGDPTHMGGAETVNLRGTEYLCRTVRDGLMITFGTRQTFERGGAELNDTLRKELDDLAQTVKGLSNYVVVRGHCSADEQDLAGVDVWTLSYARARAAAEYIEAQQVSGRRLRLEARGAGDPLESNLTMGGRAENRRVEVIVSTELVGPRRGGNR